MARVKNAAATGEKKTATRAKKTAVPTNGQNGHSAELHHPETGNLEERIRARAYELYLSRGRQHGAHEADWFTAEAEFRTRTA
jgi:hypothetical protein